MALGVMGAHHYTSMLNDISSKTDKDINREAENIGRWQKTIVAAEFWIFHLDLIWNFSKDTLPVLLNLVH